MHLHPTRRFGALASLVLLLLGLSACGKGEAKLEDAKPVAPPAELAPADVVQVETRALSRVLPLSGSLTPVIEAMVKSKVAGELLSVTVREGEYGR